MTTMISKRIMKELRELTLDPPENFLVIVNPDNIFEWHFTIKGAPDSDYDGGLYHGKIILPESYPLKPPDLLFLTVRYKNLI